MFQLLVYYYFNLTLISDPHCIDSYIMMSIPTDFYHQWRSSAMATHLLKETSGPDFPERVLHLIWMHQRFESTPCTTTCGKPIEILHPGFWNHGAGPDFRSAVLRIDDQLYKHADIELDLKPSFWRSHRHDLNPNFNKVRLHVIWEGAIPDNHPLPVLRLSDYTNESQCNLIKWAGDSVTECWPERLCGQCRSPLNQLSPESIQVLVRQAALLRLQLKAKRIEEDAREIGYRDALWLHLFNGLGYRKNQWPMRRLYYLTGKIMEDLDMKKPEETRFLMQSRLFGIANLIPKQLPQQPQKDHGYIRKCWDAWWRDRDTFEQDILPKCMWHMQSIRPANHPLRRLATVAHWMTDPNFIQRIEEWFNTPMQTRIAQEKMHALLGDYSDEFWSWHWSMTGPKMKTPSFLTGAERTNELVINVILPWLLARSGSDPTDDHNDLIQRIKRLYSNWPRAADNALLKMARTRLLNGRKCGWIQSAADQQGLLQILADFCSHTNATCEHCLFPEVVQAVEAHIAIPE